MSKLGRLGIKKVIVIDDNYYSEDYKLSNLPENTVENISNQLGDYSDCISLKDLLFANPKATIGDFFQQNEVSDEYKAEVIDILSAIVSDCDRFKVLKKDIGENNIESFDPNNREDFERLKKQITDTQEPIFIVVDKIFDTNNDEKSKKILKNVLVTIDVALKTNKLLFMVMYSSKVPKNLNDYEDVKKHLRNMADLDDDDLLINSEFPLHVNFVDKNEAPEVVIHEFVSALRSSQKASFTTLFDVAFTESMTELRKRVWELNDNEDLFYYNYLNEGQHVDNIVFDIFNANFKNYYNREKGTTYENLINPLRKSTQIFVNDIANCDPEGILSYSSRLRVMKEFDCILKNQDHLMRVSKSDDIGFGDVICIDEFEYVVVSQDCDTTIRSNSERILDSIMLVKVEKKDIKLSDKLFDILKRGTKEANLNLPKFFKKIFFPEEIIEKETEIEIEIEKELLKKLEESSGGKILKNNNIDISYAYIFANLSDGNKTDFISMINSCGLGDRVITEYTVPNKSAIISLESFWLDILLIRNEEENKSIEVTGQSIIASKELRYSTQIKITKDLGNELEKFNDLDKEMIDKIFNNRIFNSVLNIDPIFDNNEKMYGFKINNYKRIGKIDPLLTMEQYREVFNYQTRIPRNSDRLFESFDTYE